MKKEEKMKKGEKWGKSAPAAADFDRSELKFNQAHKK